MVADVRIPPLTTPRSTLLFATLLLAACSGSSGPIDGAAAYAHVERLVAIGPRPFGSEALVQAADYIAAEMKELDLELKLHEVLHAKEKKTIRNLYVRIDGEDPQQGPVLMIGAHYDTKLTDGHADAAHNFRFVGAIDGAGGPAVLIELARALKAKPPKVNVCLYWIDAEESLDWTWNDERALLGSKAFCKMLSETKQLSRVKAFVLIDLIGSKDYKIDYDGNSDNRLQEMFRVAGAAMGESARMYHFPTEAWRNEAKAQAAKRGQEPNWGMIDDHITFRNFGVPSVLLIDFERRIPGSPQVAPATNFHQWWHTAEDNLDAMDPDALAFAGNLVMRAMPDLESFCLQRK